MADSAPPIPPSPLVGRQEEMAALEEVLGLLESGDGRAISVIGGPGLGKSRLLAELAGLAGQRGVRVLSARGRGIERDLPYAVVLDLFAGALSAAERTDLLHGAADLVAPLFGAGAAAPDPTAYEPDFAYLHGLYWLAVNLATEQPVLICVDDLHWADAASTHFLAHLADRISGLPLALVFTSRSTGGLRDHRMPMASRTLHLQPLDRAEGRQVLRADLPEATDEFCAACVEVTGGNPFQIQEVVREVAAARLDSSDTEGVRRLGGRAIGRTALFRVLRLDHDTRNVATAVAVLDDGARLRHVAALTGLDAAGVATALDTLAAEGILLPGEPLNFVHPSIREALASDLPSAERSLAHRRAAAILTAEGVAPEPVAAQLLLASGMGEPWAVDVLRAAADRALGYGATEAAVRYLRRALDEPPSRTELTEVLAALGSAEASIGDPEATGHLETALAASTEPAHRAQVTRLLARSLSRANRPAEAAGVLERAMLEAGDRDEEIGSGLLADYLMTCVLQPTLRESALARVDRLLEAKSDRRLPAAVHAALAMRRSQEAAPKAETLRHATLAWSDGDVLASEGPGGPATRMIVWALILAEEYDRAEEVLTSASAAAQASGSLAAFSAASYYRAFSELRRGALAEAHADVAQAIAAGGDDQHVVAAGVLTALVLTERGEVDEAGRAIESPALAEKHWLPAGAFRLHALGRVELARRRPQEALALFLEAGRWMREHLGVEHTVIPWRQWAARAAVLAGEPEQALDTLAPLEETADRGGLRVAAGVALGVRGLATPGDEGLRLLQRSVDALAVTPARLDHARSLVDLGSAVRRTGARSEARSVLTTGWQAAERLGADLLAERAREELAATGARPRRTPASGVAALTPSEHRIAELAAQQRSNNQIAQSLFVTPKTVEYHLSNVYRKLDVSGRGELAARFFPQGG